MKTYMSMGIAVVAAMVMSGCLFIQEEARLTIRNVSESSNILEIQVRAEGQENFGPNVLEGQVAPGGTTSVVLEAPRANDNPDGVEYEVRVTFELFDVLNPSNTAVFRCVNAGDRFEWQWEPGSEPNICVD